MPYVHIQITNEGVTIEKKQELIRKVTEVLVQTLNKNPQTTFVVIEEVSTDNWGIAGKTVTEIRRDG